jgi:hypothetical protein
MMEPARSRAVFSNEDFRLLRTAVVHYARTSMDPEGPKYANLLHRLGRVAPPARQGGDAEPETAQAE